MSARFTRSLAGRLAGVAAAVGLVGGLGLAAAPAAGAAEDDQWGQTPGTYSYYGFEGEDGLSKVTWSTTVDQDPGYNSNVFWSHQFDFNQGNGAYIGMQRNGGGKPTFLFSVWDSFERKAGSEGSYCVTFGGEGEGSSCRMRRDWDPGHTYTSTVAYEGDGWFGATVKDLTTGERFKLGSVKTPATAIAPTGMVDWVEYFEWNDRRTGCYDNPASAATFGVPRATTESGVRTAGAVTKTKANPPCEAEVATRSRGSVHSLTAGNSVRAEIHGRNEKCLAPDEVTEGTEDQGGHSADGTAAVMKGCKGDGFEQGAFQQSWVRGADGSIRLPSSYCLTADGADVHIADCRNDRATGGKATDPAMLWSYDADRGTLKNKETGTYLTQQGNGVALAPRGGGGSQVWEVPAR